MSNFFPPLMTHYLALDRPLERKLKKSLYEKMPESRNPTETEDTNQEIFHAARLVFHRMIFLSCPNSGQGFGCNVCECSVRVQI